MLLSFEGIDGCGKSTQIRLLREYLTERGMDSYVFREPGGTEISEKIRSLLLHETDDMHPVTELLLFSAARSQLIDEKVTPLLESGKIVILDRFFDSTTAYQGYGRGSAGIREIEMLNMLATHGVKPDITFYLKIEPEKAQERTTENHKDRMERSGLEFFRKVSEGYDKLALREERIHTLDSTLPKSDVHQKIVSILEKYLATS